MMFRWIAELNRVAPLVFVAAVSLACGEEGTVRDRGGNASGGEGGSGATSGGTGGVIGGVGGSRPGTGGSGVGGSDSGGSGPGGNDSGSSGNGGGGVGGIAGDSGAGGSGGDGGASGSPPVGGCEMTQARVRMTEVDVASQVLNTETDAVGSLLHPIAISSIPSGGSRLAWMGNDGQAHVVRLDASDQMVGTPFGIGANSFADIYADDSGGVLLVARDAQGSGGRHCGNLDNLCGAASERTWQGQRNCWDMYLVRFDGTSVTWATKLTETSSTNPPYLTSRTSSTRVIFIWDPFAHHGRIASNGSSYAAYFGAAMSLSQGCTAQGSIYPTGVNIHQGDRMQVVGLNGQIQSGGFTWGCSHSGYERVVWDPALARYVAVCKTDNDNRLAMPSPYRTIRSVNLSYSNMSDLLTASGAGIWVMTSDIRPGQPVASNGLADIHLLRFSTGAQEQDLVLANQSGVNHRAPHLAAYGTDRMIAAWESASATGDLAFNNTQRQLYVQTVNRSTGATEGSPLAVGARGNRYHKLVSFPDGSVAFAARGSSNTRINILRILPCTGS
jgi:hypothetical protein